MAITFPELKDKLKTLDECLLLEVLGLTSEDILDRFEDIIEEKYEELVNEFQEETD